MLSYRQQLLAGFALVVIGVLVAGFFLFRGTVEEAVLKQARDSAREQLRTVAHALQQSTDKAAERSLRVRLRELGRLSNARLTLLDSQGRIVADTALSDSQLEEGDFFSHKTEIDRADQGEVGGSIRYSPAVHLKFLFVAQRVERVGELEAGYLRLGKSFDPLQERITRWTFRFFWLLAVAAVLSLPACFFLNRRLSREIVAITRDVENIGEPDKEASEASLREFVPMVRSINRISERTRQYLRELSMQRDEGEAVINGLDDGVAVLDQAGRVRRYNRAMTHIVRSRLDLAGRKPIELIPSTELQDAVEEILARREAHRGRSLYVTFYDQTHYEATLLPTLFEQEGSVEIILVLHEVTELKRLEQARKDFVANISHELRTPITSIKGYTETLLHSPPADPQTLASFMSIVARNVDNMDRLVDNLLHLSRAESSEDEGRAREEEVDLSQVLETARQVCAPLIQGKGLELEEQLPEGTVPLVLGNKEQLIRVALNLLDNAIKYSFEGGRIELRISDQGEHWRVEIEDHGTGIPPGVQGRIFERFYRGETESSGTASGAGLGLSICKHIVHRHDGEITVESPVPGELQGARFTFFLPKHKDTREASGKE